MAIVTATPTPRPSPTLIVLPPTPAATITPPAKRDVRADIPPAIIQAPISELARENLARMWSLDLPAYDYFAVAQQFGDRVGERTVERQAPILGEVRDFLVDERVVSAELVASTDSIYFWMETGYVYSSTALNEIVNTIETDVYQPTTHLFGQEWQPGIDNDPHFSILHLASIETFDEIGFFNSVNQYPAALDNASNEQEIIFLNMDQLEFGSTLYYATVAHEVQHLIQWNLDRNETVWLNEGMAQLAEINLGYQTSETRDYLNDIALQLNTWGYENDVIYRHYAASFLFLTYFWEQLGDEAVHALSASSLNGLASVREALHTYRPEISLETFLINWATANLLDDEILDSRFGYSTFHIAFPDKEDRMRDFPWEAIKSIPQYGVHYLDIRASGTFSVTFAGDSITYLLPTLPPQGARVWFTPASTDVSATLTRAFDLTETQAATLEFTAWYDLERDYDFAYVEISADNGTTWQTLPPANFSPGIYGAALTGRSAAVPSANDGWITEAIDLTAYIGQTVLIRFEVLNDGAFSEHGFALSSIGIPEINYLSTADERPDDWVAEGFAVVGIELPQQWSIQMVQGKTVTPIELDAFNQASWSVSADSQGATLIIMPQTPWIDEMATYWLKVENPTTINP
ncbi:MAG TPA: hypothetical protein ENJ56_09430 [Anaerolineae bacterium]|nr:hypothetical protein [Anaerolineae bacterium]